MNRKLDFGSAFQKNEGWIAFDLIEYGHNVVGDILEGLPWEDDFFDMAVSHHALQMFDYQELPKAISELRRVLKPNAPLRFSVPDPLAAFKAWQKGDAEALVIPDSVEPTLGGKFSAYITWYGTNKTIFTPEFATDLFHRNHWSRIFQVGAGDSFSKDLTITDLDTQPDRQNESLYFEAYK